MEEAAEEAEVDPAAEEAEEAGEPEGFLAPAVFMGLRWPPLTELTTPAMILGGRTMTPTTTPGMEERRLPARLPVADPEAEAEVVGALTETHENYEYATHPCLPL